MDQTNKRRKRQKIRDLSEWCTRKLLGFSLLPKGSMCVKSKLQLCHGSRAVTVQPGRQSVIPRLQNSTREFPWEADNISALNRLQNMSGQGAVSDQMHEKAKFCLWRGLFHWTKLPLQHQSRENPHRLFLSPNTRQTRNAGIRTVNRC